MPRLGLKHRLANRVWAVAGGLAVEARDLAASNVVLIYLYHHAFTNPWLFNSIFFAFVEQPAFRSSIRGYPEREQSLKRKV